MANLFTGKILPLKGRRQARRELKAIGESPALVAYLTMALKINPNLERAVSFAAEQLDGDMGRDLRAVICRGHLRLHSDADEGLRRFSKRWRKSCPELDRSLYLVRSSVNERNEEARKRTLDRALQLALQGARERMRRFASGIYLPTLMIYSMGVLLPLVLVVILPVLSVINVQVGLAQIFFLYCIMLPLMVYAISSEVLSRRPASLPPPKVPVKENRLRTFAVAAVIAAILPTMNAMLKFPSDIGALTILWGLALGVSSYLYLTSASALKRREEIKEMEAELCDALVQLGNRVGEGRPAEEALEQVTETMQGSKLGAVMGNASTNIRLGGMGLRAALFDEARGALAAIYSSTIRGVFKMLVSIIERSTRAAGEALLTMGRHLGELKEVEAEIRRSMGEVVTSMRSVALFFAPLVTSIAARMQGALSSKTLSIDFLGKMEVSPSDFLFVLGAYIIILAAILTNYSVEIEIGDDRLAKRVAIAIAMPIALFVFTAGAVLGGQMLSSILG